MALLSYRYAHEDVSLSKEEKTILLDWFEDELKALKQKKIKPCV
ncbi:MAG: hypothetical protein RBR59_07745 [Sulfurimonadaceae bacterium]|jgi:hypothetical protein|nr:hypothetical protein [Sulfurimonadaceae bacterium]